MPLLDLYGRIKLDEIIILREARQRRSIETSDLENSIRRIGVLQPIIINRENILQAGERRVEASRRLGLPDIPFRFADELTPIESAIIELEENVKRKDLPWQDIVRATAKIHLLFKAEYEEWSQEKTGEALSITQGTCSIYLAVAQELEEEKVAQASTVREAYNFLSRKRQRLEDEHLEEFLSPPPAPSAGPESSPPSYSHPALLNGGPALAPSILARPLEGPSPPDSTILIESFLSWAPKYAGPKFNLLHCDFPYGQQTNTSKMMSSTAFKDGRGYQDDQSTFDELLSCLIINFNNLMSVSCHLMFWYTAELELLLAVQKEMQAALLDLTFYRSPLIWLKSDNAGVASDVQRGPRHIYETCLLASRGGRKIVQTVGDAYAAPTDNRLHASCKPEPMLRHFFRMLVDESTVLLDPTCGSGSALRAAESLGAKRVLGLEVQDEIARDARKALREARMKRSLEVTTRRVEGL